MEAIGALAGGIAHDFNNLLFPILGLSEMLREDLPPASPEHGHAEEIFKAARRASGLVKQILAFSRQTEQEKTPIQIQSILKEILRLARATIPSDIAIQAHIQQGCGPVLTSPTQMHQIAMNLVTNAYHAIEPEPGEIRVGLQEVTLAKAPWPGSALAEGRYALLSVADTGCGIGPTEMGRIFEPYFTTKAPGKGTGLGLAVVYGIVKEHQGDIKVSSVPGKGSTFEVYLPLLGNTFVEIADEIAQPLPVGTERILVIDDEEAVVRLQRQMLESLGYRVSIRTDSLEGLNIFRREADRFDLVITDMTMPGMTGDRLAAELLNVRPDVPIILCTGFSERITPEKAKTIGIKDFLMKPVTKSQLAQTIRNVLDEARPSG
jgi:CheY-like chemotaxis protein